MHIGIIGTGPMALHLAKGWLQAGHTIQFASRQPQEKADFVRQAPGASIGSFAELLDTAEIILIALRYTAVESFARQYADQLRGKLVIDISNPFENLPDNRISGAEITAQAIGPGARVVAAFKTNHWETLLEPISPQTSMVRDVLFTGDDPADKEIMAHLISDLGFRPVDCGPLRSTRILDGMVSLLLELDQRYAGGAHRLSWNLID